MSHPVDTVDDDIGNAEHYAQTAGGIFDIRNVIAALFAIYGAILTVTGLIAHSSKAGVNANLWTGIVMLAVAAILIAWSLLRPVKVSADQG